MPHYHFNLKNKNLLDDIESNHKFEVNLFKNKVMLTGNAAVVEKYYKEDVARFEDKYEQSSRTNTFWYNVGPKNARVFFGIIKMINDSIVKLVTSGGFNVTVEKDDETVDEERTERLNEILEFNLFKDKKWGLGEAFSSGLGFTPIKLSIDRDIEDMPLIEVIDPMKYESQTRRGFVYLHKAKTRKEVDKTMYEIQEVHYKKDGKPVIEYKVYNVQGNTTEVKLNELTQEELEKLGLDHLDGNPIITDFESLHDLPVILHNNTAYNTFFPNAPYGEPDTQGLDLIEDALSETLSNLIEEIRKGRIKVLISEELVKRDGDGKALGFDDFKLDYELMGRFEAEGKNLIQIVQGEINSEKYVKAIGALIMYACNKAGLHPITVGLTGVESIAASDESQQEREKVSMRTREEKLARWRETLKRLFKRVLEVDDIMQSRPIGDYKIHIEFGEFSNPTPQAIISVLNEAVTAGVMSMRKAQDKWQGEDLTDEEKEIEYIRTLIEKGLPLTENQRDKYEATQRSDD